MGNALQVFRGLEPDTLVVTPMDPYLCNPKLDDVVGNYAFFNHLCLPGGSVTGGIPNLARTGTSQFTSDITLSAINTWQDVPFALGTIPIVIPAAGFWYVWATVNIFNSTGAAANVMHRLVSADTLQVLDQSIFTVPANGYGSDTVQINLTTFLNAQMKTQIQANGLITMLGNKFIGPDFAPLGAVILAVQLGP